MTNVDVNLKVPALDKLVEYAGSGIGAVAGPMLAPWKARRETKARLIEAKAEADSLKLVAEAQAEARRLLVEPENAVSGGMELEAGGITQRIEFQEKKRQANIEATVLEAAAELGDKEVFDHEPDPDWTARFFDGVQDVSSEDMRKLWAKALSGEVQRPGATSLRTLEVLRNMTAQDAAVFQEVCSYFIRDFVFRPGEGPTSHAAISFDRLLLLEDAGLIKADTTLVRKLECSPTPVYLPYQNWILRVSTTAQTTEVSVPAYPITSAGRELQRVAECTSQADYLRSFSRFLQSKGCELAAAPIIKELPGGRVRHGRDFAPIQPDDRSSGDDRP